MKQEASRWAPVADAINARMAALNLDQAELVRRSGLSDPFVRGMMRGAPRGTPRDKNLRLLATALGWTTDSIDRLLAGDDPVTVDAPPPASFMTSEERIDKFLELADQRSVLFNTLAADLRDALDRISQVELAAERSTDAVTNMTNRLAKLERMAERMDKFVQWRAADLGQPLGE